MEQKYWYCSCGVKDCNLFWRVNHCIEVGEAGESAEWLLAESGELYAFHELDFVPTRVIGQKPERRYGIALNVKEFKELGWKKKTL